MIETRNGSDMVLKQQVWGLTYVDELVQTSINSDPSADNSCETAGTDKGSRIKSGSCRL